MKYEWPDLWFPPINLYNVPKMQERVCIKQCKLDSTRSYCIGCKRTIEEIVDAGKSAKRRS